MSTRVMFSPVYLPIVERGVVVLLGRVPEVRGGGLLHNLVLYLNRSIPRDDLDYWIIEVGVATDSGIGFEAMGRQMSGSEAIPLGLTKRQFLPPLRYPVGSLVAVRWLQYGTPRPVQFASVSAEMEMRGGASA